MSTKRFLISALACAGLACTAVAQPVEIVMPNAYATVGGSNNNNTPFGNTREGQRYQQVFGSWELVSLVVPHKLVEIRFRPNQTSTFAPWSNTFDLDLRFSTTQNGPDQLVHDFTQNIGPDETVVYQGQVTIETTQSGPSAGGEPMDFDLVITFQNPFIYDPLAGHLLMDVRRIGSTLPGSRFLDSQTTTGDSVSRAFANDVNAVLATNVSTPGLIAQLIFEPLGGPPCYADCDGNEILNIDDFLCFINEFAQAQSLTPAQQVTHYANCDGSTTEPVLTIDDFLCFINEFAQGCP